MADKNQAQYQPPASNGYTRNDEESLDPREERRKKRIKLALYIVAFIVFQCIVIAVFSVVVMKVRTPKFRVGNGVVVHTLTTTPSFNMTFFAPIRVKNENFGPYKYDATTVDFTYEGVQVGQVSIPKSKANFKSTKKINMDVTVNTATLPGTTDPLVLNSVGRMTGKVELMLIFKKRKTINMNCTMIIDRPANTINSVSCK